MIFLIFLIVSVFFWILQSLQNVTEFGLDIPVTYTEIPGNLEITNDMPDGIHVTLRDKGTLMYYYYKHLKDLTVSIDPMEWYRGEGRSSIPSGTIESRLRYKLRSSTQLLSIKPDTLSINFVHKLSKKLPVSFKSDLILANQYMLTEKPQITPSFITAYASKEILDKLDSVETVKLSVKDLKNTSDYSVELKSIKGVNFSTNKVKAKLMVEEFTERSMLIPVKGRNFPSDENLLSFPSQIKIVFFVGLSSYTKINALDFNLVVDYDSLRNANANNLKPILERYPSSIRNIRLIPETVECLIEKK